MSVTSPLPNPSSVASAGTSSAGVVLRVHPSGETEFGSEADWLAGELAGGNWPVRCEREPMQAAPDEWDAGGAVLVQFGNPAEFDLYRRCQRRIGRCCAPAAFVPPGWLEVCRQLDELWLTSHEQIELFAAAGLDSARLRLVPRGVDASLVDFPPNSAPGSPSGFRFLALWEPEPDLGGDLVVQAFLQEFSADEGLTLVLVTSRDDEPALAQLTAAIERSCAPSSTFNPNILVHSGIRSARRCFELMQGASAVVLPFRADRAGVHCLEALAAGRPVIATGRGEVRDLLTSGGIEPIPVEGNVPVPPEAADEDCIGGAWPNPDFEHLRFRMREFAAHREQAAQRGREAREWLARHRAGAARLEAWLEGLANHPTQSHRTQNDRGEADRSQTGGAACR